MRRTIFLSLPLLTLGALVLTAAAPAQNSEPPPHLRVSPAAGTPNSTFTVRLTVGAAGENPDEILILGPPGTLCAVDNGGAFAGSDPATGNLKPIPVTLRFGPTLPPKRSGGSYQARVFRTPRPWCPGRWTVELHGEESPPFAPSDDVHFVVTGPPVTAAGRR